MNSKFWIRKALTTCLMSALVVTYSMVALANNGKIAGEIVITGSDSETSAVTVNGEAVKSGRTIFSSSTITTPEGAGAIINLGKLGRIELAPNTTFALSFDSAAISGDLASGSITVLNAARSVNVTTMSGPVQLNAGETATANSIASTQQTATSTKKGNWWPWVLIVGGAVAGIVWAASEDNENRFGGSATAISPTS